MSIAIPRHSITKVTADDLPMIGKYLTDSKLPLVINRLLFKDWPNHATQLAHYSRAVEGGFKNPDNETFKVVEGDTGEAVAHFVLTHIFPSKDKSEGRAQGTVEAPEYLVPEIVQLVEDSVAEINKEMKGREYLGTCQFPLFYIRFHC
jgi:hypothetical protein